MSLVSRSGVSVDKGRFMRRALLTMACLFMVAVSFGCSMCQSPYDYCYPAFGGICACERQCCGRIGSFAARSSQTMESDIEMEEVLAPPPE